MTEQRIEYLHAGYLSQSLGKEELREWAELVHDPAHEAQLKSLMKETWGQMREDLLQDMPLRHSDAIFLRIVESPGEGLVRESRRQRLWPRIAVAAAAVAAITLGTWFYFTPRHPEGSAATRDLLVNDIKPGSVGATLTLANGKTIKLSSATNGELANQAGITVSKSADGQLVYEVKPTKGTSDDLGAINTLSTAKGETYQVKLPDGTMIWLNAASSLKYAANLLQYGKRKVTLQGEAYFQVAKDKVHPFIVESKGQSVQVLGTHFNINAYPGEASIKTTLLEGSVSISSLLSSRGTAKDLNPTGPGTTILKPGQQSTLKGEVLKITQVDPSEATAWMEGYFRFYEVDLETFMNTIARWYDIEVEYEGGISRYEELAFGGSVSRSKNISAVLNILAQTGKVHYKIQGKKVTITK